MILRLWSSPQITVQGADTFEKRWSLECQPLTKCETSGLRSWDCPSADPPPSAPWGLCSDSGVPPKVSAYQEGKEDTASDRHISPHEEPVFLSLMAGLQTQSWDIQEGGAGFPGSPSLSPFPSLSHRETRGALFCVLEWPRALSPIDSPMQSRRHSPGSPITGPGSMRS